jgi:hypothetical protein
MFITRWRTVLDQLPAEIRLDGWLAATLFTSEIRGGELAVLAAFSNTLSQHEHAQSLVLGSMRETQGAPRTAYAAF